MMLRFPAGGSQRRSACLLFTARCIIGTRALASSLKPNFNLEGTIFVLLKDQKVNCSLSYYFELFRILRYVYKFRTEV